MVIIKRNSIAHLHAADRTAATTIASVFADLMNKASFHFSNDENLVIDALRRSNNDLADMPLSDMGDYIRGMDDDALRGLASNVKGIYHELRFVQQENLDGDNITARVFGATNHPGADVILSKDGNDFAELQLKATDNSSLLERHFERYSDIPVAATDEVARKIEGIQSSGFTNAELEGDVHETFADVADQSHLSQLQHSVEVSSLVAAALNVSDVLNGKASPKQASVTTLKDVGIAVSSTMLVDFLFS